MKSFIVAALLLATIAAVSCSGLSYGSYDGIGYGLAGGLGGGMGLLGDGIGYGIVGHGPRASVGPNVLYGGYTLASESVSGPLKPGILKTSFLPGLYGKGY